MAKTIRRFLEWELALPVLLAVGLFVLHLLTNGQYGFHRDELAVFDNARHLDWGYAEYPPLAPFVAWLSLQLFGPSQVGMRVAAALAPSIAIVLAALIARQLGGGRTAQALAALATGIAPVALLIGSMLAYSTFDIVWWVLIAYLTVRLLKSGDPRWWLGIGALAGLGLMTKYTIVLYLAGLAVGVILTRARRYLLSPWLWAGVALALVIVLPNLIWQAQHGFVSLDFVRAIHARDVRIGRTDGYLIEQLIFSTNPVTVPLWLAGLGFYFFATSGRPYRLLGWMFAVPFGLLWALEGRSYYVAAAYPSLFAAGAVVAERAFAALSVQRARLALGTSGSLLAASGLLLGALFVPVAPVNSALWEVTDGLHDQFRERIGWPELVQAVAQIYADLPADERAQTGILTWNYGESGAINWYGPAYGLPEAISPANSGWLRGYGNPPPQTVIVLGLPPGNAHNYFESCTSAGRVTNAYGVRNEETKDSPFIYVCRQPRWSWDRMWEIMRRFI